VNGKDDLSRKGGFTLLEAVLVTTLLVLLAAIAASTHRNRVVSARESVLRHNLSQLRLTLDAYNADRGHYPSSLSLLVDEGYLRSLPMDPFTGTADSWQLTYENQVFFDDPLAASGIFDIHSGSDLKALDGTFYHEW
jgi:general secretion pathway protein G